MGPAPTFTIQPCNGSETYKIAHNLGANHAAYAGVVPVLNTWIAGLFAFDDTTLGNYSLHIQLALGCDAGWNGSCADRKIDNGFEQLFLSSTTVPVVNVPEPTSLALLGIGLLGLGALSRKRQKTV